MGGKGPVGSRTLYGRLKRPLQPRACFTFLVRVVFPSGVEPPRSAFAGQTPDPLAGTQESLGLPWNLWRPHDDSNVNPRFRRPVLFPLSYGGDGSRPALT